MSEASPRDGFARFVGGDIRWLASGFAVFFLSSVAQTYFVGLSIGDVRSEFDLSHADIGLLNMAVMRLSGVCVFLIGKWTDVFPIRRIGAVLLPALAVGCVLFQSQLSLPVVLIGPFILRIGAQGFRTHIAFVAVGRWFDADRGIALATASVGQSVGQNVGQMLLPFVFVTISATLGWRGAWRVLAAALVLAAPVLASLSRVERTPETRADPGAPADPADRPPSRTLSQALTKPEFHAYVFAILPMAFVATTIFFYQVHLVDSRSRSLDVFTASYSVMAISTVASGFAAGWLVDRRSASSMPPCYLAPLAPGCLALALVSSQWIVIPFMILAGVSNGFSLTLYGAAWPEAYGVRHLGAIRAAVTRIALFAAATGPGLAGLLFDRGVGFGQVLLLLAGLCARASIVVRPVARRAAPLR